MSQLKIPIHAAHFTTASYEIMDRVSVDLCGPFPQDDYNNTYIAVFIDNFSRYIEIFPIMEKSAKCVATCLLQWVGRYGSPTYLLSDNGKEFVNDIIKEFTDLIGTEQIFTLAYSKQENAIAERALKEVQRHLRAILYHKNVHYDWSVYLPLVQRILNSEVHSSTGVSPAQLIFGNSINLDKGIFLPKNVNKDEEESLSSWTAKLLNYQSRALTIARHTQSEKDKKASSICS
jgi:transposase InsO family protein